MVFHKSKRIVIVSHCILNQNVVVDGLERAEGPLAITRLFTDRGIGILQLPCPEFFMMNLDRPGMNYSEYDGPEYRQIARRLIEPVVWQVEQYRRFGYEIIGLVGINESPNCSLSGQVGVFMDELLNALEEKGIQLNLMEVPPDYGSSESVDLRVHHDIINFLEE